MTTETLGTLTTVLDLNSATFDTAIKSAEDKLKKFAQQQRLITFTISETEKAFRSIVEQLKKTDEAYAQMESTANAVVNTAKGFATGGVAGGAVAAFSSAVQEVVKWWSEAKIAAEEAQAIQIKMAESAAEKIIKQAEAVKKLADETSNLTDEMTAMGLTAISPKTSERAASAYVKYTKAREGGESAAVVEQLKKQWEIMTQMDEAKASVDTKHTQTIVDTDAALNDLIQALYDATDAARYNTEGMNPYTYTHLQFPDGLRHRVSDADAWEQLYAQQTYYREPIDVSKGIAEAADIAGGGAGGLGAALGTAIGGPAGMIAGQLIGDKVSDVFGELVGRIIESIPGGKLGGFAGRNATGIGIGALGLAGAAVSPMLAVPGALMAIGGFGSALLDLATETKSFQRLEEMSNAAFEKLVGAIEPLWGSIAEMASKIGPVLWEIAGGEVYLRLMFDGIKTAGVAMASLTADFYRVGQGLYSFMEALLAQAGDKKGAKYYGKLADQAGDMAEAAASAAVSIGAMQYGASEAADEFERLNRSMTNMPSWYRVAQAEYHGSDAAFGGSPTNIQISTLYIETSNPDNFWSKVQNTAQRRSGRTGAGVSSSRYGSRG